MKPAASHIQVSLFSYVPPEEPTATPQPSPFLDTSWDVETLYTLWELTKKGVIIFHDTATTQQVAVERDLLRQFIAAGRNTTTRYRISIVGGHGVTAIEQLGYSAGFRPQVNNRQPTGYVIEHGLRLDYQSPGMTGYAVFCHLINKGVLGTKKQIKVWASEPTLVYI